MKSIVQLLGAVLAAIAPLITGEALGVTGWINVGVVAAGAVTVYIAANDETGGIWSITKMLMSLISTVGVVLISSLSDGSMSVSDWMQAGAAVLATLAVFEFPKEFSFAGPHGEHERS